MSGIGDALPLPLEVLREERESDLQAADQLLQPLTCVEPRVGERKKEKKTKNAAVLYSCTDDLHAGFLAQYRKSIRLIECYNAQFVFFFNALVSRYPVLHTSHIP